MGVAFLVNRKCPPDLEPQDRLFYIGRPGPLGNPFPLSGESERDKVVEAHRAWLEQEITNGNQRIESALKEIEGMLETGDVGLECYCAPKRCHGENIIRVLEARKIGLR